MTKKPNPDIRKIINAIDDLRETFMNLLSTIREQMRSENRVDEQRNELEILRRQLIDMHLERQRELEQRLSRRRKKRKRAR